MSLLATPQGFSVERVKRVYTPLGTTETWAVEGGLTGWLDMLTGSDLPSGSGDNAFVEESTHVLITDGMPATVPTNADRIVTDVLGRVFHVTYVDDVTGVGHHLEIYLRHAGAEAAT